MRYKGPQTTNAKGQLVPAGPVSYHSTQPDTPSSNFCVLGYYDCVINLVAESLCQMLTRQKPHWEHDLRTFAPKLQPLPKTVIARPVVSLWWQSARPIHLLQYLN